MSQRVRIVGLGSSGFHKTVLALQTIHEVMTRQLAADICPEWQPGVIHGHPAIDINAPYFAREGNTPASNFPTFVDPDGVLQRCGNAKGLKLSKDCFVEFYERKVAIEGEKRYATVPHRDPALTYRTVSCSIRRRSLEHSGGDTSWR